MLFMYNNYIFKQHTKEVRAVDLTRYTRKIAKFRIEIKEITINLGFIRIVLVVKHD